jgi:putative tricarboxylic transport membrane protein
VKSLDRISSLCLVFLASGITIQAYILGPGTWADPGPGFFPMGSGIALGLISFLILAGALLDSKPEKENTLWPGKRDMKKIILVILSVLLYAVLIEYLGFILCTFFCMLFLLKVIEPQKWIPAFFFAAITSLISYTVFEIFLKSQLPRGIIMGP